MGSYAGHRPEGDHTSDGDDGRVGRGAMRPLIVPITPGARRYTQIEVEGNGVPVQNDVGFDSDEDDYHNDDADDRDHNPKHEHEHEREHEHEHKHEYDANEAEAALVEAPHAPDVPEAPSLAKAYTALLQGTSGKESDRNARTVPSRFTHVDSGLADMGLEDSPIHPHAQHTSTLPGGQHLVFGHIDSGFHEMEDADIDRELAGVGGNEELWRVNERQHDHRSSGRRRLADWKWDEQAEREGEGQGTGMGDGDVDVYGDSERGEVEEDGGVSLIEGV